MKDNLDRPPVGFHDLSWAAGVFDAVGDIAFGKNGAVEVRARMDYTVGKEMSRTLGAGVYEGHYWVLPASQQVRVLTQLQAYLRDKGKKDLTSRAIMYRAVGGRGRKQDEAVREFRSKLRLQWRVRSLEEGHEDGRRS